MRVDDSYTDARGVTIHFSVWRPGKPKGVVQILHGLGEYSLRYETFAQELVDAGYAVYADDHRGHGRTGMQQHGDVAKLGKLGPGGMDATVAAIARFTGLIRHREPGLPLAAVGQSWGSLMLQMILQRHAADYDAAVLLGTAHRTVSGMNAGDLNARHKHLGDTGFEWLSRDPEVAREFAADAHTFMATAIETFGVIDSAKLLGRPSRRMTGQVPLLILVGDDDSLGGGRSATRLADDYVRRAHQRDVTVKIYPGARHELLRETNRDEVVDEIVGWLDKRVK